MPLDFLGFMLQYGNIVVKLSQLLNKKFLKREDFQRPIGQAIENIIRLHNMGMYEQRDYEIARLKMLVKHLEEVKQQNENMFKIFQTRINKSDTDYLGFRFELATAASLIRKGINFEKTESPDFTINWKGHKIGIECVNVHIEKPTSKNLIHKIKKAIKRKAGKTYSIVTSKILLFIDVTNIYFHGLLRGELFDEKELKERIGRILNLTNFGGILLFVFVLNKTLSRFELNYFRIDKPKIDPLLKDFLDYCYPCGSHDVYDFALPQKG